MTPPTDRFYRFRDGGFVQAPNFNEAKRIKLESIVAETEDPYSWSDCTCTGFQHRPHCHLHVECY